LETIQAAPYVSFGFPSNPAWNGSGELVAANSGSDIHWNGTTGS